MTDNFDVICMGAALVDMVSQVERHPGEDDEVFVSDLSMFSGGAAANTAHACAILNLKTAFLGKLGYNDTFGAKILDDFQSVNVQTSLIKYSHDHGTGSAYVALNSGGDRRIYAHSGAANYLSKEDILEEDIIHSKIIFLSSLKNIEPFIEAARIARENEIIVILNPGMLIIDQGFEKIKTLLEKIDIFILSQREFLTLLKIQEETLDIHEIQENAHKLLDLGIKLLIVTLGERGSALVDESQGEIISPLSVNKVIDTTGAGDAFSAGFMYGLCQDLSFRFKDLRRNVKIGNFVAGRCIQELGARNGIPKPIDIRKVLSLD